MWCYAMGKYDGTKERFWRESCETIFTHLVTIFRVEFLWGCFVQFVGFADDVVPVGCARISVLLLLYNMHVSCHRHFFLVLLLNQR